MPVVFTTSPLKVATPAAATEPTTTTALLTVLGAETGVAESTLTYTWVTTGTPPAAVNFGAANGTNAGKSETATFTKAGTYNFLVTITDATGASTTSATSLTVAQALTAVVVTPATTSVGELGTQAFSATANDQFGTALATQPSSFTWATTAGSITSAGSIRWNSERWRTFCGQQRKRLRSDCGWALRIRHQFWAVDIQAFAGG